jgi:S1-C subfamily serine protease
MKKAIFTAAAITVFSLVAMASPAFAQENNSKINHPQIQHGKPKKTQMFHHQRGQQQQFVVEPGYNQPTPKLGFQGQILGGYGMKVVSVNWGTAAQRIGLESGDVITQIHGRQIRSQWDYDQALRDAAMYQSGRVSLLVRNVRFDWGWNVPEYVSSSTVLDGFGYPQGPVGPRSVGPDVAAQQR